MQRRIFVVSERRQLIEKVTRTLVTNARQSGTGSLREVQARCCGGTEGMVPVVGRIKLQEEKDFMKEMVYELSVEEWVKL